ncbi:GlxA family transcriptional regulator [Erythrobacteraceae bacterium E2-1 Yellow Sea]|nr:GlxA family transcriptional regulator [Erythrobacteraceae bacterium E2-1 Yellow Sea]
MPNLDRRRWDSCRTLGLLMIDGFALMSYASLIEPFRAANTIRGTQLYRWFHVGLQGEYAQASNGARIAVDRQVGDTIECDMLCVFAAGNPAEFRDKKAIAWLRRIGRQDVTIVGISGGPYILARAGLLEGHRATIHWEHLIELTDEFPQLAINTDLYVIDRRRITCAGGTAALDLAIELIEHDCGVSLASQVSEWFIRTEARTAERPQRLGLRERFRTANDTVLRVLAVMETEIETPLSRKELARIFDVSMRQLDRLFVSQIGQTVARSYLEIRLEHAHKLLRSTSLSITEIGVACGFANSSHFSHSYRSRFGRSPRSTKKDYSNPRMLAQEPNQRG